MAFLSGQRCTHLLAFKEPFVGRFLRALASLASLIYWRCFAGRIICNFFKSNEFYQFPLLSSLEVISNNQVMQNTL